MKTLIQAVVAAMVAAPAFAQEAPDATGALLDAMTCREFLGMSAQDQMTVMLVMRAHVNGDPLPDEPLPIGVEAEVGGADGLGGDSGSPDAEGLDTSGDAAGADGVTAGGDASSGDDTAAAESTETEITADAADTDADAAGAEGATASNDGAAETQEAAAADEGTTATSVGDEEVVDGENESGKVNPDGTEMSVSDEPADPKLRSMRTSCEGGPDALATDAMRAAHADYE